MCARGYNELERKPREPLTYSQNTIIKMYKSVYTQLPAQAQVRKKRLNTNQDNPLQFLKGILKRVREHNKLLRKKRKRKKKEEEKPIKCIKDTYRTSYNLHRRTMTWAGVQSECSLLSQSLLQESSNPHPAL
jgi:hypothetical protein